METNKYQKQMISIKTSRTIEFVKPHEVLYCIIEENTVIIKLQSGKTIIARENLKTLEKEFAGYPYFRCHSNCLINLSFIQRYTNKTGELEMTDNVVLFVSKKRRPDFRKIICKF